MNMRLRSKPMTPGARPIRLDRALKFDIIFKAGD